MRAESQAVIGRRPGRVSLRGRGPGRIVSFGAGWKPQRLDLGNPCLEVPGPERPEGWERGLGGVRFKFPGESGVGAQAAEAEPKPAQTATSPGTPSLLLDNTPPSPGPPSPKPPPFLQPRIPWHVPLDLGVSVLTRPSQPPNFTPQTCPAPPRTSSPRSTAFAPRFARLVMRHSTRSFGPLRLTGELFQQIPEPTPRTYRGNKNSVTESPPVTETLVASYSSSKDQSAIEDWQKLTFKYMKTTQQRRKKFLTVGISSVSPLEESNLLYTLDSLFRTSSKAEQKHFTVLIHLADSDLTWLGETVARISSLFSPEILAGQLLLIHAPSDAYPPVDGIRNNTYSGEFYSKQNVDHAFLMSYASNLSDYFLLLDDNVFCGPNFVSHIKWKVTNMNSKPWVLLEFSNMGFLGKLFHSRDLPLLAHFLLLFYREKPLDRLIPHFRTLLLQKNPVLCRPFLFYHRVSHPSFDDNWKTSTVKKKDSYRPDNPPGTVFTDMKAFDVHFPWEAYTLDESFFWTYNVSVGNHLTVLLSHPVNLRRVQVMTGSLVEGKYTLEKGQVELGYTPERMSEFCTSFTLLGRLLEGQLDQEVFPKNIGHSVSCVRLVVKASQVGGLMIRHISLWEEKAKEKEGATS
ncbi:alpha-1,3-mannosyl-glycoprotein 4-beta-N-acetylglucosaminyltransferase-like protein MGAT4E [Loxodonta africana]